MKKRETPRQNWKWGTWNITCDQDLQVPAKKATYFFDDNQKQWDRMGAKRKWHEKTSGNECGGHSTAKYHTSPLVVMGGGGEKREKKQEIGG